MQTYTHFAIGSLMAVACYPDNLWGQAAVVAGSVASDFVPAVKYALDKSRDIRPFSHESKRLMILTEISHSLLIWLFLGWLAQAVCPWLLAKLLVNAFWLGGLSHLAIDALTHADNKNWTVGMLWPIPGHLPGWIGIWEYRYGNGILRPKPPEAAIFSLSILAALWLWL